MLTSYLNFRFDVHGKPINGFCMRIQDDFHETYAVIVDGYRSFCVWLDSSSTWRFSKHTSLEPSALEQIISRITSTELPKK